MKKPDILDTPYVYPAYDKKEGNIAYENQYEDYFYVIDIKTYIRKKYNDVWYLISLSLTNKIICRKFSDNESDKKDANQEIINRLMIEAYSIIMFYKIPRLRHVVSERPILYIDADQRNEQERVLPRIVIPII